MKSFLSTLLSFWLLGTMAQEKSTRPIATLVVEPDRIFIGEPVRIRYQIQTPEGSTPQFIGALQIPSVEVLRTSDTTWQMDGQNRLHARVWEITSFDTGSLLIPAQSWQLGGQIYTTNTDTLLVQYSLQQTPLQYHDLKDILESPFVKNRWSLIWLLIPSILLAWIGYRYYQSKKRVPASVPLPEKPVLNPLDTAEQNIQQLLAKDPPLPADEWYWTLSQIWHQYLASTCAYPLGELTPMHISALLQQRLIPTTDRLAIEQLFEKASLSKFAQYPVEETERRTDAAFLANWLQAHDPLFYPLKTSL